MTAMLFADVVLKSAAQIRHPDGRWRRGTLLPLAELADVAAAPLSAAKVQDSYRRYMAGELPPPIDVVEDAEGRRLLVKGHSRLTAARMAGVEAVPVRLHRLSETFGKRAGVEGVVAKDLDAGDVHLPATLTPPKARHRHAAAQEEGGEGEYDVAISVPIAKADDELRVVYGWAAVSTVDGRLVLDTQQDILPVAVLTKAVHAFMSDSRAAGVLHVKMDGAPVKVGEVVESLVLTADVQKSLGIELGREGWFVGVHVTNDVVWQAVKDGHLTSFSIGGRGVRIPLPAAA